MIESQSTTIEQDAQKAYSLSFCRGVSLNTIKKCVEEMLSHIGKQGFFEEYTLHNINHVNEMLEICEWLIPEATKKMLTNAEKLMLTLAVYLHDLGMVISNEEFEQRDQSSSYVDYKQKYLSLLNSRDKVVDEKYIYQEFVRKYHAKRIKNWIEGGSSEYGIATVQANIIGKELSCIKDPFKSDLAMICESHCLDDIDDFTKYKVQKSYGSSNEAQVNLNYIAIILRTADLLHITNGRTPSITKKLVAVSDPKSLFEWAKQEAVYSVIPIAERNADGKIDSNINKHTIQVSANFDDSEKAAAYFGLERYLEYVKKELNRCNQIAELAKKQEGSKYDFPWTNIDQTEIAVKGFEKEKLSFILEQEKILNLLVGHTLYNDSSVAVRELTQNAIDAIKLQALIDNENGIENDGKVTIKWSTKERILEFYDNGTGMTIFDIKNYLFKVGASKYQDNSIKEKYQTFSPISRFGIGILTCFMVAESIEIETNPNNTEEATYIRIESLNGQYLLMKKDKSKCYDYIKDHGTVFKLKIKDDVDMSSLEKNLKKWIVCPGIAVELSVDGSDSLRIDKSSPKEVIIDYLEKKGYKIDNATRRVDEIEKDGVTVACAMVFNKYLSDWEFMTLPNNEEKTNKNLPIGTCVEGIRVEFNTPGYENINENIIALANIIQRKYKTNVARTALEFDSNKETMSLIYDCYSSFTKEQIDEFERKGNSKARALREFSYIMQPLIYSASPVDTNLFFDRLSEIPCIFVEQNGQQTVMSINQIRNLDTFDIIDCRAIEAICALFEETKNVVSVSEIVKLVSGGLSIFETSHQVLTNFKQYNKLHMWALREKEISEISVDFENRIIKLTFTKKSKKWVKVSINNEYRYRSYNFINIPLTTFNISGLQNEIGVRTIGGIYLDSESQLCKYIQRIYNELKCDTEESRNLFRLFLEFIFGTDVLEYQFKSEKASYIMQNTLHKLLISSGYNKDLEALLWSKISKEEFSKTVLEESYSIFSTSNFDRSNQKKDFER